MELLDQIRLDDAFDLYVPIGGGGLIFGIAAALKQTDPRVRVIGVESELENDACQSFRTYILHIGARIKPELSVLKSAGLRLSAVSGNGYVEQSQDIELQICEHGLDHLDGLAVVKEGVALGEAEEAQDVLGGRALAGAALGV